MWSTDSPRVLERVEGRLGELVLRTDGADFEVISNGVFLMDTPHPRSRPWEASALRKGSATGSLDVQAASTASRARLRKSTVGCP